MIRYVKDDEWGTTFPNFQKWEFMCNHKSVGDGIYYSLLEVMQDIRNRFGSVSLSCGYRCPICNAQVGGDPNSAHLYGGACDFRLDSGWQDNLENRKRLVTELRQNPKVHYCYCKVDDNHIWDGYTLIATHCNMGTYIHCDTYPSYKTTPIGEFKIEDTGEDYVKVSFKPSDNSNNAYDWCSYKLDDNDWKNMPLDNTVRNLIPNTSYRISIKLRDTGTDNWEYSQTLDFTTKEAPKETQEVPLIDEKPSESTIIPEEPKTLENEPLNEKIEQPTNNVVHQKSILQIIIEFIFGLFMKRR